MPAETLSRSADNKAEELPPLPADVAEHVRHAASMSGNRLPPLLREVAELHLLSNLTREMHEGNINSITREALPLGEHKDLVEALAEAIKQWPRQTYALLLACSKVPLKYTGLPKTIELPDIKESKPSTRKLLPQEIAVMEARDRREKRKKNSPSAKATKKPKELGTLVDELPEEFRARAIELMGIMPKLPTTEECLSTATQEQKSALAESAHLLYLHGKTINQVQKMTGLRWQTIRRLLVLEKIQQDSRVPESVAEISHRAETQGQRGAKNINEQTRCLVAALMRFALAIGESEYKEIATTLDISGATPPIWASERQEIRKIDDLIAMGKGKKVEAKA